MTTIEKMYECYGVKPSYKCEYLHCTIRNEENCTECKKDKTKVYPPFTAEKQLELLKLVTQFSSPFEIRYTKSQNLGCMVYVIGSWYKTSNKEFSLALAEFLTDMEDGLDHAKVREILE